MIGIDVGGANTKIVSDKGVHIHYCPLWQGSPLRDILGRYRDEGPAAVVMSGELADCFRSKMDGIRFIVGEVVAVFPGSLFYGTDGKFHEDAVPELAAANWLASADFLGRKCPDAVLVDIGSTTTDVVPLSSPERLVGLTDLARLQTGLLVYTGLLRTGIETAISIVNVGGIPTPVCPEHFAIAADAYLALGLVSDSDYTCETPDRGPRNRQGSLRRLSRVVCADLSEIGEEGATDIARAFVARQQAQVREAVRNVSESRGLRRVVTAGIGSGIFARVLAATDLRLRLGPAADALPTFAVREVARRDRGS